ncbi:hypothetical protein DPEC_G00278420 [Dallia pectoralis]|uniref:Uncharacterized protein n=1 Tax=Dallia pectoralis TaxID=75939 RepID=A0ACC2FM42_DALPE|nr:hypothetical protein DPEC_G00278420 [Dallia pectoralis]
MTKTSHFSPSLRAAGRGRRGWPAGAARKNPVCFGGRRRRRCRDVFAHLRGVLRLLTVCCSCAPVEPRGQEVNEFTSLANIQMVVPVCSRQSKRSVLQTSFGHPAFAGFYIFHPADYMKFI